MPTSSTGSSPSSSTTTEVEHKKGDVMRVDATNADDVVSVERGEIDRRIYSDEEIFEQEMELIFGRAWLFLCHETQIRNPGDFFEAPMGRDNVLVVRQKDGSIKALLNTC